MQHLVGLSLFLGRARKKVKLLLLNAVYMSCFYNYYIIIVIVLEKGRKFNGGGGFQKPSFFNKTMTLKWDFCGRSMDIFCNNTLS